MQTPSEKLNVHFKTEHRSDGGLRIYATEPTGLYVSSKYTYPAAEYFQRLIVFVAVSNMSKKDGGVEFPLDHDWDNIVAKGGDVWEFQSVDRVDVEAVDEEYGTSSEPNDGDFPRMAGEEAPMAEFELRVEPRVVGTKKIIVVNDPGEPDRELEEIIRRQETIQ